MDLNQTIRAPSSMIRLPKVTSYTGLPKFKLLGNNSTALRNDIQTKSQPVQFANSPLLKHTTNQQPAIPNITTRIPATSKPSGLVKPTPVKQIVAAVSSTTTTIRPSIQRPLSSSSTNSSISNSKQATLKLRPTINSATVRKTKALYRPNQSSNNSISSSSSTNTTPSANLNKIDISFLNTFTGDVGEIRRLLERLLKLLENSHENHESLVEENERLKREIIDLKETIKAINETSSIVSPNPSSRTRSGPSNISTYFSPMS